MTTVTKYEFKYCDDWIFPDTILFGSANIWTLNRADSETADERCARLDQYDEFVNWLNGGALSAAKVKAATLSADAIGVIEVLYEDATGRISAFPINGGAQLRVVGVNK